MTDCENCQRLTAERDELRWERDDVSSDLDDVSRDLIAARAELAAANKAANDLQVVLTHAFEDIANVQADNAALSARLERVQALADEWDRNVKAMLRGGGGILSATVRDVEQRLRAALGEDA